MEVKARWRKCTNLGKPSFEIRVWRGFWHFGTMYHKDEAPAIVAAGLQVLAPADRLALLAQQPEVAELVDVAATAMRQWRGVSDELRRIRKAVPVESGEDAEARVYREAEAALAPWRPAKEMTRHDA